MFLLVPPPPVPPTSPSWLAARAHGLRYRWRLARLIWRYRRASRPMELVGFLLGLTGAAWVANLAGLLGDRVLGLHPLLQGALVSAALLLAGALLAKHVLRIDRLFEYAAEDTTGEKARRLRECMRDGMDADAAYNNLARVYLPKLREVNASISAQGGTRQLEMVVVDGEPDRPFLVAVLRASTGEELSELLDPQLTVRRADREPSFADPRQGYMNRLPGRSASHLRDDESGDNLVLEHVRYNATGRLRLTASVGTYGQIVRSCDSLLNEFAVFGFLCDDRRPKAPAGAPPPPPSWSQRRPTWWGAPVQLTAKQAMATLPWRRTVHSWYDDGRAEDFLLHPGRRAAGLGVALTMLDEGAPGKVAFVGRRGPAVGTYPDVKHVLPAGMCNTKDDFRAVANPKVEPDFLQYTMLTELLEERHSVAELENYRSDDWRREVRRHCQEHGVHMQAPQFTGLAFDLLNLRPEVCGLIRVTRPTGSDDGWRSNWEYIDDKLLLNLDLSQVNPSLDNRTNYVQSGAASLALAYHA